MEDGGVEVVDGGGVFVGFEAEAVACAVGVGFFDAGSG